MVSTLEKLAFTARQGSRVAWYMGHYLASSRYRKVEGKPVEKEAAGPRPVSGPSIPGLLSDLANLYETDLANAEAGHYPVPRDISGTPADWLKTSRKYFADLPVAADRKRERRGREVAEQTESGDLPAYFLQNFHYQTGGYLTEESAELYDMQVEVLFSGSANAMRRRCLVPVSEFVRGRDQRQLTLADIACGTGRFLRFAAGAFPRLKCTGIDLSDAYLAEARRHLRHYPSVEFRQANAERLPFEDASLDLVTSIYLFHEVPPKVRRSIAAEFARVLKPGGRLVFMDSLQIGDTPAYDRMLESFPANFHEPFYNSYAREDLPALFAETGLDHVRSEPVFLSKLVVCDKPA